MTFELEAIKVCADDFGERRHSNSHTCDYNEKVKKFKWHIQFFNKVKWMFQRKPNKAFVVNRNKYSRIRQIPYTAATSS